MDIGVTEVDNAKSPPPKVRAGSSLPVTGIEPA